MDDISGFLDTIPDAPSTHDLIANIPDADQVTPMHEARFNAARELPDDTPQDFVARNLGHFTSTLTGHVLSKRAQQRIGAGAPEPGDYDIVARHERLNELAQQSESGFLGSVGAMALRAPEMIAMGALAPGAGPGASLGTRVAVGGATTALNPSMWVPEAVQRAESQGGNLLAPENALPALGSATVQNAIFAGVGELGKGLANPVRAWANRTGASILAQQGGDALVSKLDDYLPQAYQTKTRYGAMGALLRGEQGEAMKSLAVQAIQHGAFALMHHGDREKAKETVRESLERQVEAAGAQSEPEAKAEQPAAPPKTLEQLFEEQGAPKDTRTPRDLTAVESTQLSLMQNERKQIREFLDNHRRQEEAWGPGKSAMSPHDIASARARLAELEGQMDRLKYGDQKPAEPAKPAEAKPAEAKPAEAAAPKAGEPAPQTAEGEHPVDKAFREAFPNAEWKGEGKGTRFEAKVGEGEDARDVYISVGTVESAIRLDFGFSDKEKTGRGGDLKKGSLSLARGLKKFLNGFKKSGMDLEYRAIGGREDVYAPSLEKAGYEKVFDDGKGNFRWRLAPERSPEWHSTYERLKKSGLAEDKAKGLADLQHPPEKATLPPGEGVAGGEEVLQPRGPEPGGAGGEKSRAGEVSGDRGAGAPAPAKAPEGGPAGAGEGGRPGEASQERPTELTPENKALPPEVRQNLRDGLSPEQARLVHDLDAKNSGRATLAERMKARGRQDVPSQPNVSPQTPADRFRASVQAGEQGALEKFFDDAGLTKQERDVLQSRMAGESHPDIGKRVGLTRQRIQQIEKAAAKKIGMDVSMAKGVMAQDKMDRANALIEDGGGVNASDLHADPDVRRGAGMRAKDLDSIDAKLDKLLDQYANGEINDEEYTAAHNELTQHRQGRHRPQKGKPSALPEAGEQPPPARRAAGGLPEQPAGSTVERPGQPAAQNAEAAPAPAVSEAAGNKLGSESSVVNHLNSLFTNVEKEDEGAYNARLGDLKLSATYTAGDESTGLGPVVGLDFTSKGRSTQAEIPKQPPRADAIRFARALKELVNRLGSEGISVSFDAEERRSETYRRVLGEAGFGRNERYNKEIGGRVFTSDETWSPAAPEASGERFLHGPPAPGEAPAAANQPSGKAVSQFDIISTIKSLFGLPTYGGAEQGSYDLHNESTTIPSARAGEAPLLTHELAHHLERQLGLTGALTSNALPQDVRAGLAQFDYIPNRPNALVGAREGFAEWLRRRSTGQLSNLSKEQEAAAGFLEGLMASKPGVTNALDRVRDLFSQYEAQSPKEKYGGLISETGKPAEPVLKPGEKATGFARRFRDWFLDKLVDDAMPARRAERAAEEKGAKFKPGTKFSEVVATGRVRTAPLAREFEEGGVHGYDPVTGKQVQLSKPLKEVLGDLQGDELKDLERFMHAQRDRHDATVKKLPIPAADLQLANDTLREIYADPAKADRLKKVADGITDIFNATLRAMAMAGWKTKEYVEALIKENPFYVPTTKIPEHEWFNPTPDFMKARKGSSGEQRIGLMDAIQERYQFLANILNKQAKFKALMDLSTRPGVGQWLSPGQPGEEPTPGLGGVTGWPRDGTRPSITGHVDGKPITIRINDKAFFEMASGTQGEGDVMHGFLKGLGDLMQKTYIPQTIRAGATALSPAWLAKSAVRDLFLYPQRTVADRNVIQSLGDLVAWYGKGMEFYGRALLSGGAENVALKRQTDIYFKLMERMTGREHGASGEQVMDGFSGFFKRMSDFFTSTEKATRVLELKNAWDKLGWTKERINAELAKDPSQRNPVPFAEQVAGLDIASQITHNVHQQGEWVRQLNRSTPFLGAHIAGVYKDLQSFAKNPAKVAGTLAILAAAKAVEYSMNKDDEEWQSLPDHYRYGFSFKTPVGWMHIPAPRGISGVITGMMDYATRKMGEANPNFAGLAHQAFGELAPNVVPEPVNTALHVAANKDTFGRPIDRDADKLGLGERFTTLGAGRHVLGQATGGISERLIHGYQAAAEGEPGKIASTLNPFSINLKPKDARDVQSFYQAYRDTLGDYSKKRLETKKDMGLKEKEPPELKMLEKYGAKISDLDRKYYASKGNPNDQKEIRAAQAEYARAALETLKEYQKERQRSSSGK